MAEVCDMSALDAALAATREAATEPLQAVVSQTLDPASRSHTARRWVVERTHTWLNRSRRLLLVRWENRRRTTLTSRTGYPASFSNSKNCEG
jgi:hypothetical protein